MHEIGLDGAVEKTVSNIYIIFAFGLNKILFIHRNHKLNK